MIIKVLRGSPSISAVARRLIALAWAMALPAHAASPASSIATALPAQIGPAYAIPTSHDRIGRLVARVMIDGQGPYRFLVDSGANHTAIAASLASRLSLKLDEGARLMVNGIAGSLQAPTVVVSRLQSGALRMRNLRLPVLNGPLMSDIDGILGIDGLADSSMTADFVHDRLVIAGATGGVTGAEVSMPAHLISRHLFVIDCEVGAVPVKAIIDTGSQRTLGNPALLAALLRRYPMSGSSYSTSILDATGTSQAGALHYIPSLRFGSLSMTSFYMTFGDFRVFHVWDLDHRPALILGMDVLGLFSQLTLDYRRNSFGVLPRPEMELPSIQAVIE
jgi:predicted aspartyl protease